MRFIYRDRDEGVEILRCLGAGGQVEIPEQIGGRPVTALGPYVFSAGMRQEPEGMTDGGTREDLEPVCGDLLESLTLPESIRTIGRYGFYNCGSLKRLECYTSIRDLGAGTFTGVRKMEELAVTEALGERSCLKELLAELSMELTLELTGRDGKTAALLFPEFYEEAVENTPARILETHMHGSGHRYRYCFKHTEFQFEEYDKLFAYAKAEESRETSVRLALLRLMNPVKLLEIYAKEYRQYVCAHAGFALECLLLKNQMKEFRWLIQLLQKERAIGRGSETAVAADEGRAVRALEGSINLWQSADDAADMDKLLQTALRLGRNEAVSILMDLAGKTSRTVRKSFDLL